MKSDSLWENKIHPDTKLPAAQPSLNLTGFNVLPAGIRFKTLSNSNSSKNNGLFRNDPHNAIFITTMDFGTTHFNYQSFYGYHVDEFAYYVPIMNRGHLKTSGESVRCLKDESN